MAFDYGTKRVGIAVTDPLHIIATPLTTVPTTDIISFVKQYCEQEPVSTFVVGEPKQMNNLPSSISPQVESFVKDLQRNFPTINVCRIDERFTSKMASRAIAESDLSKRNRQQKSLIDKTSATLILQSFMAQAGQ